MFRISGNATGTWLYWKKGQCYTPSISEVLDYDAVIEDDMVDAAMYSLKSKYMEDIHKKMKDDVERGIRDECGIPRRSFADKEYHRIFGVPLVTAKRHRVGIITNITEGGNEMRKQLYHVILFNKKTEEIDFKAYIPAKDEESAAMTAVQTYGKYDANIHKHIVKLIDDSDYEPVK